MAEKKAPPTMTFQVREAITVVNSSPSAQTATQTEAVRLADNESLPKKGIRHEI
jgi:hypothetical protein